MHGNKASMNAQGQNLPSMLALVPAGSSKLHPRNEAFSRLASTILTPRKFAPWEEKWNAGK